MLSAGNYLFLQDHFPLPNRVRHVFVPGINVITKVPASLYVGRYTFYWISSIKMEIYYKSFSYMSWTVLSYMVFPCYRLIGKDHQVLSIVFSLSC